MRTTSKLALATLCLGVAAGAVGVTQSWFVSLNRTPPGSILSAVVHYLPEFQVDQSMDDLLTYGNLVGGTGVDEEGIPHVLPGEALLSTVLEEGVVPNATRTVDTSRVRAYQVGETVRTVIKGENRSYTVQVPVLGEDGKPVLDENGQEMTTPETRYVSKYQRDLFASQETVTVDGVAGLPDLTGWELFNLVTDRQEPVTADGKTVTVITTTATYVLTADRTQQKIVVTTLTETVTHEAERYVGDETQFATGTWVNTMTETVLAILPDRSGNPEYTRTQLTVTGPGRGVAEGVNGHLPLSVGNVSTVATNLRLGVTATLTAKDPEGGQTTTKTLEVKSVGGAHYLGLADTVSGKFVELLEINLDGRWKATSEANIWDLTLPDGGLTIPAQIDPLADPVRYTAVTGVAVATSSHFGLEQEPFELRFNELYAQNNPIIDLRIRFYAKQADYMDWAEFHTAGLTLNVAQGVSQGGGGQP